MSWVFQPKHSRESFSELLLTPYVSVRSLKYRADRRSKYFGTFFINALMSLIFIVLARELLAPLSVLDVWLFSPMILFFTEGLGAFGQWIFSYNPVATYPIHNRPLKSKSLSQFWGRHWNLWIQDWLKDVRYYLAPKKSGLKLAVAFCFSGIFHEIMCNLPYFIVYQKSYFGTMMGYFLIQATGLWVDKSFLRFRSPLLRRAFLWLLVIGPSPLFINVPLLTFFGLNHD
ncbi:MAG TPA: MBOAT family protein [Bacteriovoracaceae bacterium]|nr:MBOAT family protein [Bacteriovoracaceae bacterium]